MTLLRDAMTAYLSGLTTKKTDKEIWWENKRGEKITVELVDADLEKYIVRHYHENGNLMFEDNFIKDLLCGVGKMCDINGNTELEYECYDGKFHGFYRCYWCDGNIRTELLYKNGLLHGLCKYYNEDGILTNTIKYINGERQ